MMLTDANILESTIFQKRKKKSAVYSNVFKGHILFQESFLQIFKDLM